MKRDIVFLLRKVFDRHFALVALLKRAAHRAHAAFAERKRDNRTYNDAGDAADQNASEKESITQECHR